MKHCNGVPLCDKHLEELTHSPSPSCQFCEKERYSKLLLSCLELEEKLKLEKDRVEARDRLVADYHTRALEAEKTAEELRTRLDEYTGF